MKVHSGLAYLSALLVTLASANTEKTIFVAPVGLVISDAQPSLEILQVQELTHNNATLRTYLGAEFPSESALHGREHWYLLRDLIAGQRYELRVCWAATVSRSSV